MSSSQNPSKKEKNTSPSESKKVEFIMENYIEDPVLLKDYRELFLPLKKRGQYVIIYSTLCFFGAFQYIKNLNYYMNKFFKNRKPGLVSLLRISSIHVATFFTILLGGNCLALQLNPYTFISKMRELDERMLAADPNSQMTVQEFFDGFMKTKEAEEIVKDPSQNSNVFEAESNEKI